MYDAVVMKEGKRLQASLADRRYLLLIHSTTKHSKLYSRFILQTGRTEKQAFAYGVNPHMGNLSLIPNYTGPAKKHIYSTPEQIPSYS